MEQIINSNISNVSLILEIQELYVLLDSIVIKPTTRFMLI